MSVDPSLVLLDSVECELLRIAASNSTPRPEPQNRPSGAVASFVVFWFVVASTSLFFLTFVLAKYLHPRRKQLYRLQHRGTVNVFVSHLGVVLFSVSGSYFQSQELRYGLPCAAFIMITTVAVPFIIFPVVSRLLQLYRKRQYTRNVVHATERNYAHHDDSSSVGASEAYSGVSAASLWARIKVFLGVFFFTENLVNRLRGKGSITSTAGAGAVLRMRAEGTGTRKQEMRMRVLRALKSETGANTVLFIIVLPYVLTGIIFLATSEYVKKGCYGCVPTPVQLNISLFGGACVIFLMGFVLSLNAGADDPYGYIQEAKIAVLGSGIWAVLFYILNAALRSYMLKSNFQFLMPAELCLVGVAFSLSALQVIFALRDLRRADTLMTMPVMQFSFEQFEEQCLTKNGRFHDAFAKHLESEFSYESMAFLESAEAWEKAYFDLGPKTSRTRAKRIANMFIGDHAELPCNLSATVASKLLSRLQRDRPDQPDIQADVFAEAVTEIKYMLFRDAFPRFLNSEAFRKARPSVVPGEALSIAARVSSL